MKKKRSTLRWEARRFLCWRRANGGNVDMYTLHRNSVRVSGQERRERNAGVVPIDEIFALNEREGRLA